jgi:hypothetical protein
MCPRAGVGRKTMQTKGTGAVHCLLLGTLLLGGSCAGPSVPRSAVQAPWGIVRAPEARRAGEVSGVMARLVSAVALESGVQDPPPVEIWQLSHEIEGPLVANTRPGRIELGAEVGTLLGDEDGLTWLLAHEYAHWCLHSAEERQWDALPTLLAEGLAEAIVLRALPHLARSAWAEHRAALESIERIESGQTLFNLTLEEWGGVRTPEQARVLYAIGAVLASRIGREGLAELCERARGEALETVPGAWILARAQMESLTRERLLAALDHHVAHAPQPPPAAAR